MLLPKQYGLHQPKKPDAPVDTPGPGVSTRIIDFDDVPVATDTNGSQSKQNAASSASSINDSVDTAVSDAAGRLRRQNTRHLRDPCANVRPPVFFRNLAIAPRLSPIGKKRPDFAMTPLMQAYYDGNLSILESMLIESNLYDCHRGNQTLADIAASDGQLHVLDILHNKGVNFDRKNTDNQMPLHYAVENEQTRAMRKLVTLGANPNIPLPSGEYPLHRACGFPTIDVLSCLIGKCRNAVTVIP